MFSGHTRFYCWNHSKCLFILQMRKPVTDQVQVAQQSWHLSSGPWMWCHGLRGVTFQGQGVWEWQRGWCSTNVERFVLLVFTVFETEKKEFYIMDFKLSFLWEIITKLGVLNLISNIPIVDIFCIYCFSCFWRCSLIKIENFFNS